jgi:hypothetical protein
LVAPPPAPRAAAVLLAPASMALRVGDSAFIVARADFHLAIASPTLEVANPGENGGSLLGAAITFVFHRRHGVRRLELYQPSRSSRRWVDARP